MAAPDVKMWGGEPYYGLGYDFDPTWFLSDEDQALEAEIIDACERVIRPLAIEADRTGEYPWASVEAIARLRLLAMIAPTSTAAGGASHVRC